MEEQLDQSEQADRQVGKEEEARNQWKKKLRTPREKQQ